MTIYNKRATLLLPKTKRSILTFSWVLIFSLIASSPVLAQNNKNNISEKELLEQYTRSKGQGIITFDASNIKQYWIDNSVVSQNGSICISLEMAKNNTFESNLLKLQLINVTATQECTVTVLTETKDISFAVVNDNSKVVSLSESQEKFINYYELASTFRLIETEKNVFYLRFLSPESQSAVIKSIVLSFHEKKSFPAYPGYLRITPENVQLPSEATKSENDMGYVVKGKAILIVSNNKIKVSNNKLSSSVKVKNLNNNPVNIYFGYSPYSKDENRIDNRAIPYKNQNTILKVISSEDNSNKITVDKCPEWEKNCFLAMNAKEDLSDFPNMTFINGSIQDIKKIDDNRTEITFDKTIQKGIPTGTLVRVQSPHGASRIWTNINTIQPGEEAILTSSIEKRDSFLQYSPAAFCRGTDSVVPVLYIPSTDDITIEFSDFIISY